MSDTLIVDTKDTKAKDKEEIKREKQRLRREKWRDAHRDSVNENARRYAREHPGYYAEITRNHRKNNKDKVKARDFARGQVRYGKMEVPDCCSSCGITGIQIEGHHMDYSKPGELTWLCRKCHRKLHRDIQK